MKLLYIAFADLSDEASGVVRKIYDQCAAFRRGGFDVYLAGRMGTNAVVNGKVIGRFSSSTDNPALLSVINKRNQINALKDFLDENSFDRCYIRYDLSSRGFVELLKKLGCKTFLEIATYPYRREYGLRPAYLPKLAADRFWRGRLRDYVDRIVTFYPEKEIFGIPAISVPNGFDFGRCKAASAELGRDIHIAAATSMRKWHGYERFIKGMGEYYKNGGRENIVLHLAGTGRELKKYRRIVKKLGLGNRVIFEGRLSAGELDRLYEGCGLALDSLARHRSGITVLSSLKSREYAAHGLPFVSSCRIDVDDGCPYIFYVPADESAVDIGAVLEFYRKVYSRPRWAAAEELRAYMEERTDMNKTMAAVIEELKK